MSPADPRSAAPDTRELARGPRGRGVAAGLYVRALLPALVGGAALAYSESRLIPFDAYPNVALRPEEVPRLHAYLLGATGAVALLVALPWTLIGWLHVVRRPALALALLAAIDVALFAPLLSGSGAFVEAYRGPALLGALGATGLTSAWLGRLLAPAASPPRARLLALAVDRRVVLAVCSLGVVGATHAFRAVHEYGFLYPALLFLLAFWAVGFAFLALHAWFPPAPRGRAAWLGAIGSAAALSVAGHLATERIELVRVRMLVDHHRRALGLLLSPGLTARREGAKVAGRLFPRALPTRAVPPRMAAGAPPFRREPHVVVLALDALRRDAVGALGGVQGVTPALDALATRAEVWERAYAPGPGTGLSVGSLLTGLPPATLMAAGALPLTLPAALRERGYVTSSSSAPIHLQLGTYPALRDRDAEELGFAEIHPPGGATVSDQDEGRIEGLTERLAAAEAPRFEYVHLMGSHGPFPRAELPGAYHAAARRADALLGRLVAAIDARAAGRPTLLCVLGDHGEGLGEHGFFAHNQALYAEQTAVPLLCAVPGVPAARHPEPVSLFALPGLLFAALGSRWPGPTLEARVSPPGGLAVSEHFIQDRLVWRALWTPDASLHDRLLEGRREVFDLRRDPGELADLAFGGAAPPGLAALAAEVEAAERALAREVEALAE